MARKPKFGITYTVRIDGLRETLAKFRELPKEASKELRTETLKLSKSLASEVKEAARAEGRQWGILARTVKARRDRVPSVEAGGETPLIGRNEKPPFKLLFGAEFGATYLDQFKPRTPGNAGYVFFPTARRMEPEIESGWNKVADDIVRRFGEGG